MQRGDAVDVDHRGDSAAVVDELTRAARDQLAVGPEPTSQIADGDRAIRRGRAQDLEDLITEVDRHKADNQLS